MLPKKGFTYKCKMSFNQYVKNEIYKCVQDGYLEVNGLNYRIQDENFFEGYFSIHKTLVVRLNFGDLNISNDASIMYPKGRVNRNNPIELIKQTGLTADEVGEFHKKLVDWHIPKDINGNNFNIEPLTTFSKNLTKDKIVLQVMNDLNSRSRVGIEKYNTTLERTDLELKDWLQHLLEELMDATLYLKRIQNEINNRNL